MSYSSGVTEIAMSYSSGDTHLLDTDRSDGSRTSTFSTNRRRNFPSLHTAGINRSNTAVRAVLEQPCSTGGRTGTVQPKHLPAGRTGLSDQFLGPVAQDQSGPVGQICPTSWLLLRSDSDSARPTTGQTRLFEHRSNCRVRPVNAGSELVVAKMTRSSRRRSKERTGVHAATAAGSPTCRASS
ncbi:hypothetical protein PCANC_28801 [Puccinia coronata f. sp. avenae]|uniref:Uncharacterized protein n=1 Tax=Puccinia coronata f. sp. avenae TaxID=200324 RepID=A0A2N5RU48_9BASI|nr:hypothetical protein PCANC_28801 [Puccinia coronata f. sp. avenae]PLW32515.1 hypothetical protein PCASD_14634 [Puccinia coronata f. sp. avenae]